MDDRKNTQKSISNQENEEERNHLSDSSFAFDIINSSVEIHSKKKDLTSVEQSKFFEMPLQISNLKNNKIKSPFLMVEDKGFTKEKYL
jgi:hypothetical protein